MVLLLMIQYHKYDIHLICRRIDSFWFLVEGYLGTKSKTLFCSTTTGVGFFEDVIVGWGLRLYWFETNTTDSIYKKATKTTKLHCVGKRRRNTIACLVFATALYLNRMQMCC